MKHHKCYHCKEEIIQISYAQLYSSNLDDNTFCHISCYKDNKNQYREKRILATVIHRGSDNERYGVVHDKDGVFTIDHKTRQVIKRNY